MDSSHFLSIKLLLGNILAWGGAIVGNLTQWMDSAKSVIGLAVLILSALASIETIRTARARRRKSETPPRHE